MKTAIITENTRTLKTSALVSTIAKEKLFCVKSVNHKRNLINISFTGASETATIPPITGIPAIIGKKKDSTHIAIITYVSNRLNNGERIVISIPISDSIGVVYNTAKTVVIKAVFILP